MAMAATPAVAPGDGVRFGLIVPSSNVTIERELPAMLARREAAGPGAGRFSFHSSRVRMRSVTPGAWPR
jgi:maleate isomerase